MRILFTLIIPALPSSGSSQESSLSSPFEGHCRPQLIERRYETGDLEFAMKRPWRQPDPLQAARHGRIVDRLHIDLELGEKPVGKALAQERIADDDRHHMAWRYRDRKTHAGKLALEECRMLLLQGAFLRAHLQMADAGN